MNGAPDIIAAMGEVAPDVWDRFVAGHPDATPYHTSAWSEILRRTFGLQARHLFALRNGQVTGLLPLFSRTGRRMSSSPFRDQGGVLAADPAAAAALLAGLDARWPGAAVEIKQGDAGLSELFARHGFAPWTYWVTTRVALPDDPDYLWRAMDAKARGKVRAAQRAGISVVLRNDRHGARLFHNLFWRTRRDLGAPCYAPALFDAIADQLGPSGAGRFLLARTQEGDIIGGMVLLSHGGGAVDAYAASSSAARRFKPNDLLVWEALRHAIAEGRRVFDFGADAPWQDSLLQFKRKWGGQPAPLTFFCRSAPGAAPPADPALSPAGRLAAQLLPRLPGPLYRAASGLAVGLLARRL